MALFGLAWGGGLFWAGGGFSSAEYYVDKDYFSLRLMGVLIALVAVSGFIFQVMKQRAPERLKDKPTEAGEVSFDVDAALANYLSTRPGKPLDTRSTPAPQITDRKVFGRRGADDV